MSGTSLDGIDVAFVETDGRDRVIAGPTLTTPYPRDFREKLRSVLGGVGPITEVEDELTRLHAAAVEEFLGLHPASPVEIIGFHGHTILHRPAERRTWQIGDGAALANRLGREVVADFRSADVAAGGEGAPLAPLFHAALTAKLPKPIAVLNIGGVGNVTWIGEDAHILAFDTGPGNALIDDWVRGQTGAEADFGGALARAGQAVLPSITQFLDNPYFDRHPPKSLDRDDFRGAMPLGLSLEDGAATLTEMTAAAVAAGTRHFLAPAREWLVTGGGRHNPTLMEVLRRRLGARCARSKLSAAMAMRSKHRHSPISPSARSRDCRYPCPRRPVSRGRPAAAGCFRRPRRTIGMAAGKSDRGWRGSAQPFLPALSPLEARPHTLHFHADNADGSVNQNVAYHNHSAGIAEIAC